MKIRIVSWADRAYNRIFNRKLCIRLIFDKEMYEYNDTLISGDGDVRFRCLGNNWYKISAVYGRLENRGQ